MARSLFLDPDVSEDEIVFHSRFADLKLTVADRCLRQSGTLIKHVEAQFRHEITNQYL